MATDHNFRIKNGLTVQGSTLVVNNTENISGTQVYIKKLDSSTNLQRWGEGTNGGQQSTFRFRIDQNFKFIGNSGSGDTITIFSSSGDVNTAGNITITDNSSYLATRQILARDTNGLTLKTSGGTEALAIHNNGRVGIAASTSTSSSNALKLHVGTINNTGSSAIAQFGGFIRASEYYILHETTGSTNSIFIDYNGNDLDVRAGEGSYTGVIRTNGYKVGTTTVIDSSRNLLNIGTIGSGAITSTGAVNATYFSDGYIQWTAAQLNRYGAAIELQFSPTNSSTLVKIGANGSNPTIFNAYTGAATFNGAVTSSGAITGSSLSSTSGDISLNGETFVREKLYSGVSNIGASGSYYTLFNITESNTPTYITLKTAAHSTQTFVVTTGYWGSNVAHVQMLSSTYTQNGAYPGVSAVRILKDSSNNYKFQLKLTYSSGPTGFYIYARAFGATGAADVPTFESSLTVDSSTGSTIDELDTGFTGTSSSRQHRAGVGSNSTPSYSFTGDSNTGMYRDTSDSIGFASNGAQRVTISNSGLDIKSGTLRISGTDVISSSRNLTNIGTATFNGGVTMNSTLNCASTIGIAGTTVIDGSRNLTNIGTISSGAITSSGTLNTQANSAAAGVNIKRTNAGSGGSKGFIAFRDVNNKVTASIYSVASGGDNNGDLRFSTSNSANTDQPYSLTTALTLDTSQNATFAGSITSSGSITSGGTLTGASSELLRRFISSWTIPTQTVLGSYYGTNLGDYIYLKAPGNSTAAHGIALVTDNAFFYGRTSIETGQVTNSSSAPLDESTGFKVTYDGNATFAGTISSGAITSSGQITSGGIIQADLLKGISSPTNNYINFNDDTTTYGDSTNVTTVASVADVAIATNTNDGGGGDFIVATGSGGTKRFEVSAAGAVTHNNAYTFPTSDGSSGQVLQTDGSGNLSFATSSGGVSLSNGANNRIVTATSASSINAEANLQYDGSALDIYTGSIPVTDNHVGLTFRQTGTYSDGRYEHRFRKRDEGGGIPLYIDKTSGTANAHTAIVRFGGYSANTQEFEVYGNAKVDNLEVTSEGSTSTLTLGKYDSTDQGVLYLTGSTANKQSVLKTTNGNLHLDSASGNNTYINFYTGAGTYFGSGAGGISAVMGADGDLWKGNADNTGSKYWHAGNDGAGSGLDADTLDGYDLGAIDHAEGFKVWTGINADTTQAKRRVIGRLYGCPNHWSSNWHNIEITVTSEYYESGYAKYRIMGDYGSGSGGMLTLHLVESHGPMIPRARIVLGSAVDAGWDSGGQDVFYQDLYADAAFYGQFKVHAKTYGHGYQTSNPTSGAGITVFYASPSVSNISDFTDSKTTTYQQGYTIWNSGNDGSGTGLDSDTVDGIQASSFLRSDASDTYSSGTLTFGSGSGLDLATFDIYGSMRVIRNNKASSDGMYIGYLNTNSGHTRIFGGGQGSGGIRVQGSGNNDIKMGTSAGTAWHSANDGSGSGLDADTVDGIQASSFIRQGTNAPSNSTFSNAIGEGFRFQRVTGGSDRFYTSHHNLLQLPNNSGDQYVAQLAMGTGDTKIGWRGKTNTTWTSWYDIWHSGNDGSGSSLDADLLDGSEGSYYRNASNINTGTLSSGRMPSTPPNTYIYGTDTLGAFDSSTFAVNPPRMGFFNINNSSAENPAGFGYWQGLHFRHNNQSSTWGWQLAGTYNSVYDDLYFRQIASASRGSWNKIWSSNNDGAGSGLDADTLDGHQGTNYKRNNDFGNTAEPGPYYSTGTYIYDTTNSTRYYWLLLGTIAASSCKGSIEYEAKDDENYPNFVKGTIAFGGFNSGTSFSVQHDQQTADPFGVQVRLDTSRRIWIRFPNCDWSHFFRFRVHDSNGNFTTNTSWSTGTTRYDTASSPSEPPNSSSDILGGQNLRATSSSVTGTVPSYSNFQYFPKVFARERIEVDNNLVFHAGNDGSGSGLDADTVDGINSASFLRSDTSDSFGSNSANQYIRFNCNSGQYIASGGSSSRFPIEIFSPTANGGDAGITFHVSGDYAGFFGLASDWNDLAWGGWSVGSTTKYRIAHTGNLGTTLSGYWNSSNDGSGSGLDADTVDGLQPSSMSVDAANESHMVTGSAFSTSAAPDSVLEYQQASGQTDTKLAPSTNWHNTIRMGHGDPYTYYSNTLAVRMTGSGLGDIYSQTISNNNAQGWNKHWHTNNDGSGSGLDADLLDGLDSSQFVRSDTSDTMLGNYTIDNGTNTLLGIRCDNGGNAIVRAGGQGQGTGVFEVSQDDGSHGGGMSYNGDGSPSFVSGETADHVTFYRLDAGTRTEVFHYPYNSSTVNFNSVPTVGGTSLVKTSDTIAQASNAGTLDNLDSTQFLRSDTSDTMTAGRLSFHTSNVQAPTSSNATTGARLNLYPLGSGRDYSIGIENSHMWFNTDGGYKFYEDGSIRVTFSSGGNITATGDVTAFSDKRLKTNIKTLDGKKALQMRGVSFEKNGGQGSGVIAQELEKIAPELVHTSNDDMQTKSVAYGNLVGYLIEAIKTQQEQIDELKQQVQDLGNQK